MSIKGTIIRAHVAITAAYISTANVHRLEKLRAAVRGSRLISPAITTARNLCEAEGSPCLSIINGYLLHRVGDCGCFKFHDDALPRAGLRH